MPRMRVHELAKELGITSKTLREDLTKRGEFVKSASSMVEAPIVRQMLEEYASASKSEPAAPVKSAKPAKSPTTQAKTPAPAAKPDAPTPAPAPGPKPAASAPKPGAV